MRGNGDPLADAQHREPADPLRDLDPGSGGDLAVLAKSTTDDGTAWHQARTRIWRALNRIWPRGRKIGSNDPKMQLAEDLAEDLLPWMRAWHPSDELLADVHAQLLADGHRYLADCVQVARIRARLWDHERSGMDRGPTPEWWQWLMDWCYTASMPHEPARMARRLRWLADEIDRRSAAEGYVQQDMDVGDRGRPF